MKTLYTIHYSIDIQTQDQEALTKISKDVNLHLHKKDIAVHYNCVYES